MRGRRHPADEPDRLRRAVFAACVGAPLAGAALLARRPRGALVGARPFTDGQVGRGRFPRRLVDAAGQVRVLAAPPRRIVSTYLGSDETLAALVDVERVVGVSAYADDPATSNCFGVYPRRVARVRAEPERVLALEPDLVCVAAYSEPEAIRLLAGAGPVLLLWSRFNSFADVIDGVRVLGAAVGADDRAEALAASIERELEDIRRRMQGVTPVRVLYYDSPGYTMGAGTLVDEMLTRAGGRNAAAELGIQGPGQIGVEMVLALQPQVIVMPRYEGSASPVVAQLAGQPAWMGVGALAAGRVREVPGAWITSVSHHASRGLAHLARVLHPEVFG